MSLVIDFDLERRAALFFLPFCFIVLCWVLSRVELLLEVLCGAFLVNH